MHAKHEDKQLANPPIVLLALQTVHEEDRLLDGVDLRLREYNKQYEQFEHAINNHGCRVRHLNQILSIVLGDIDITKGRIAEISTLVHHRRWHPQQLTAVGVLEGLMRLVCLHKAVVPAQDNDEGVEYLEQ